MKKKKALGMIQTSFVEDPERSLLERIESLERRSSGLFKRNEDIKKELIVNQGILEDLKDQILKIGG